MLYNLTVLREPHDIDLSHAPGRANGPGRAARETRSPPGAGGNIRHVLHSRTNGEGGQHTQQRIVASQGNC